MNHEPGVSTTVLLLDWASSEIFNGQRGKATSNSEVQLVAILLLFMQLIGIYVILISSLSKYQWLRTVVTVEKFSFKTAIRCRQLDSWLDLYLVVKEYLILNVPLHAAANLFPLRGPARVAVDVHPWGPDARNWGMRSSHGSAVVRSRRRTNNGRRQWPTLAGCKVKKGLTNGW